MFSGDRCVEAEATRFIIPPVFSLKSARFVVVKLQGHRKGTSPVALIFLQLEGVPKKTMAPKRTTGRESRLQSLAPYDDPLKPLKQNDRDELAVADHPATESIDYEEEDFEDVIKPDNETDGNIGDIVTNANADADADVDADADADVDADADSCLNASKETLSENHSPTEAPAVPQSDQLLVTKEEPQSKVPKTYVGNLPYHVTTSELRSFVSATGGEIVSCEIVLDRDGRSRGYGLVEFASRQDAERAWNKLNLTHYQGRSIEVREDRSRPSPINLSGRTPIEQRLHEGSATTSSTVFVGNLSWHCKESDLKELLSRAGVVESVEIIRDRFSGKSKGM